MLLFFCYLEMRDSDYSVRGRGKGRGKGRGERPSQPKKYEEPEKPVSHNICLTPLL